METQFGSLLSQSAQSKLRVLKALDTLLEHEEMEAVTVKQLCAESGVGKSTFYTYFEDKYAIIQWYTDLCYDLGVAKIGRTLTWREGHMISTTGYAKHLNTIKVSLRSKDYNALSPYSVRRRMSSLMRTLTEYKHIKITYHLHMQVIGLSSAELAIFERCLKMKRFPAVEDVVDAFLDVVPSELFHLLEEPTTHDSSSGDIDDFLVFLDRSSCIPNS